MAERVGSGSRAVARRAIEWCKRTSRASCDRKRAAPKRGPSLGRKRPCEGKLDIGSGLRRNKGSRENITGIVHKRCVRDIFAAVDAPACLLRMALLHCGE